MAAAGGGGDVPMAVGTDVDAAAAAAPSSSSSSSSSSSGDTSSDPGSSCGGRIDPEMLKEIEAQIAAEQAAAAAGDILMPAGAGGGDAVDDDPAASMPSPAMLPFDALDAAGSLASASSTTSSSSDDDSHSAEAQREVLHAKMPGFADRVGEVMATAHAKGAQGFRPDTEKYMALATELFLKHLGQAAMKQAQRDNKREADYSHIAQLARRQPYGFLQPMFTSDGQTTLI